MSYLRDAQLAELVGSTRPSTQIQWLRKNGWHFAVRHNGRPRVAQAEHDRNMVGGKPQKQEQQWEPDAA